MIGVVQVLSANLNSFPKTKHLSLYTRGPLTDFGKEDVCILNDQIKALCFETNLEVRSNIMIPPNETHCTQKLELYSFMERDWVFEIRCLHENRAITFRNSMSISEEPLVFEFFRYILDNGKLQEIRYDFIGCVEYPPVHERFSVSDLTESPEKVTSLLYYPPFADVSNHLLRTMFLIHLAASASYSSSGQSRVDRRRVLQGLP